MQAPLGLVSHTAAVYRAGAGAAPAQLAQSLPTAWYGLHSAHYCSPHCTVLQVWAGRGEPRSGSQVCWCRLQAVEAVNWVCVQLPGGVGRAG